MSNRVFIPCLNKQRKLYNCNIGALIGCVIGLVLLGTSKGVIWGLGGGAIGFGVGNYLSTAWFVGNIQRFLYWQLPYAKDWLDRNAPDSSEQEEL